MIKSDQKTISLKFIPIIFFFITHAIQAQNSLGLRESESSEAISFFSTGEYQKVVSILKEKDPRSLDEEFLLRISESITDEQSVHDLEKLVKDNPGHPLASKANYQLGRFHFEEQKWEPAEMYLKDLDANNVDNHFKSDYYLMLGYLNLQDQGFELARQNFERSRQFQKKFNGSLSYYLGYVFYQLDDLDKAERHLTVVKGDPEYGRSATYYLGVIHTEKEEYDKALSLAQSELNDDIELENSAFHQLIGEVYARQNQASKASNYLERAIELHPLEPSAALYYQAGVALYKTKSEEKAIQYLTKSGLQSGEYAQLSAFQLGRLYSERGESQKALSAYIEASNSEDPTIKEESLFQSGKLRISLEDFAEGINYLEDYIKEFPNGQWIDESKDLLAEGYLRTSNYDQAINYLEQSGLASSNQQKIYQKVAFSKAQLMYNDGEFSEAIFWFDKSLNYPIQKDLANETYFYLGEAYFELADYNKAIQSYKRQQPPGKETFYGLGYSHYNLIQYNQAINYFQQYVSMTTSSHSKRDAQIRMADCYYAEKSYAKALELYNKVSREKSSSYLFYHIGLVNESLGNTERALKSLERVLSMEDESYKDDALLQIAQINFEEASFEEARMQFTRLINEYPDSEYLPEAYLNRGVSSVNLGDLDKSRLDYEKVINDFSTSPNAFDAILGLQELNQKGIRVGNLDRLIKLFKEANPGDESLEVVEYEAAKSLYFQPNYESAIVSIVSFIDSYPNSRFLEEASYYLGDAYYRLGELEKSAEIFEKLKNTRNNLTGRILGRLADINYQLKDYQSSVEVYSILKSLELSPKDNYKARQGLMNTYFEMNRYNDAIDEANEIMASEWKPLNAERQAILIKSKSYLKLDDIDSAIDGFSKISQGSDQISAEAVYNKAKVEFLSGDHSTSLETLFDLNSRFGSYSSWIDQSYLLIADNYLKMGEAFQAKATLRSIVQHSSDEDVKSIALEKLTEIENSVDTDTLLIDENDQK